MKTMIAKSKILLTRIGAFGLSIAPILVAVGFNWENYTATTKETIKLSAGAIILIFFLFMKSIGKLKLPEKRIIIYLIIFGLSYLLESVLYDLVMLSGSALLGELLELPIEKKAEKMEDELEINKQAEATAKQIKAIQQEETSGRV